MTPQELRIHLRRLDDVGKLRQLLAKPWGRLLSWADIARWMQYVAFLAAAIGIARSAKVEPALAESQRLAGFALLALALALRWGWWTLRTPIERREARVRRRGELVPAAMVQVNDGFFAPGNEEDWPGSVVFSFDPEALRSPERLVRVAQRLQESKHADRGTVPPRQAEIAWSLFHEMVPTRSLPVPPELSEGLTDCVLACTTFPSKPYSADGHLWALALRGNTSSDVAVIPEGAVVGAPRVSALRALVGRWLP